MHRIRDSGLKALSGKNLVKNLIGLVLLLLVVRVAGCSDSLIYRPDAQRICPLVTPAYSSGDFTALKTELKLQFGVDEGDIRVRKEGVFVPTIRLFVTERGYFIAKHQDIDYQGSGDPAFRPVSNCIFAYHIAG